MSQDPTAKLTSRIAAWQSCVGPVGPVETQEAPAAPRTAIEVASSTALLPVAHRTPSPEGSGESRWSQVEDLRETVDFERERSRQLAETLVREQTLHAASLILAERSSPIERPVVRTPPSARDLQDAMPAFSPRRYRKQGARRVRMEVILLLFLGAAAGCLVFWTRLW